MGKPFLCLSNAAWNQFIDHFFQVVYLHLSGHDFRHLPGLVDLLNAERTRSSESGCVFLVKPTQNR